MHKPTDTHEAGGEAATATARGWATTATDWPLVPEDLPAQLPAHLVPLPGGPWALWRWAGLRGTGFPLAGLAKLAAPACARAADELSQAEDRAEEVWRAAQAAVSDALKVAAPEAHAALSRAQRQLRKGKAPEPLALAGGDTAELARALADFAAAAAAVERGYAEFQQAFDAATLTTAQTLAALLAEPRFGAAVTWQNRAALATARARLWPVPPLAARNKHHRQSEELLASYWQRYCAKNDTIGFFGPVGWARLTEDAVPLRVQPGPDLLAERCVHFSDWALDELAAALAADPEIRPWLVPQRAANILQVTADTLHLPLGTRVPLDQRLAAVLQVCDGRQTARALAAALCAAAPALWPDAATVYATLAAGVQQGWLYWQPRITAGAFPERDLLRALETIAEPAVRQRALAVYGELEACRAAVTAASDDPAQLGAALGELDATFTRLTGSAATRGAGQMYANRNVVYEDCRRDLTLTLGRPVLDALGPPLALLLTTARWFTHQLAATYETTFHEIYARLARELAPAEVDAGSFWARLQAIFYGHKQDQSAALRQVMTERWAALLQLTPEQAATQARVQFRSADLLPQVQAAFAAPAPGWAGARQHSPDLMIAAPSAAAFAAGDFQLVLGEVHLAVNTLNYAFFVAHHPAPEELFDAFATDFPAPRVILMQPKTWAGRTARTHSAIAAAKDICLEYAVDAPGLPSAQALPISELVVRAAPSGSGLTLQTRDGAFQCPLLEALAEALMTQVINSFKLLVTGRHAPRITIDRLVVSRETWRFAAAELDFASDKDEAARFLAVRRWAQEHGLPRYVFYKSPVEIKPCFLDFESPLLVNLFAKIVRRTQTQPPPAHVDGDPELISISEMLPTPEQVWLPDAAGNCYASEFRLVAVDLANYPFAESGASGTAGN